MVIRHIGVEIGAGTLHLDNAQHARIRELMQRVVDGGQRNGEARILSFLMQRFSRNVTITGGEQEICERDTLACRTQARTPQTLFERNLLAFIRDRQ